ncbi:MAG TPA: sigma-70 family RNA polymerase sigma factor [Thermoanaerobaculia bacterium]
MKGQTLSDEKAVAPGGGGSITQLLQKWSAGDQEAAERVLPLVYNELRRIASRQLRRERCDHTLQATAIVHEAYLRLDGQEGFHWPSREHFFAFAAHLIRRILVDYARHQKRLKRGGGMERVTLSEAADLTMVKSVDLLEVDEALAALEAIDPRKAAVVELRFFAGLTLEETAAQLGISPETVGREWRRAKAWLYRELQPEERA